jgi:hypothetical protein
MEVFGMAGLFGLILGFMFGVGCAAAVIYTVYMGGYRKALRDSLMSEVPERFRQELSKAQVKADRERTTQ